MIKDEKFDLILLLLISLLLSIYLFFYTYVISLDGAFAYVPMAKDFASSSFRKVLQQYGPQPLYSLLVAMVSHITGEFEVAGKLVSTFFGILIILPVYFLGKSIFEQKIALLSALFIVIHPYIRRFSADVLKESTYLFFLGTAIWYAWRTIHNEKGYPFLFIPLFSVLAYLVRPDGFEVLLVVFFYVIFVKKFSIPGRKRTVILLLLLSSCILFLPYLIHLREVKGEWTLSKAKSIEGILGLGVMGDAVPFTQKVLYSLKRLNLEIFTRFHPVYIILLIVGLLKRIFSRFKTGEGYLLSFCALHYVILFLMVLNTTEWGADKTVQVDQFSSRHVLPLLLISIYWVGEGFITIHQLISKKAESRTLFLRLRSNGKSAIIFVTLVALILAIVLPKTLKAQRYDRLPEKWAGMWIKNQSGKGRIIFTTLPRVAYYADGDCEYIDFEKDVMTSIKASMVKKGALYLVLREREVLGYPGAVEPLLRGFIELMRYEEKGMEKVVVYRRIR